MATKIFVPVIIGVFGVLAGCTTTARINHRDIESMEINCSQKEEQIAFIKSQWPSEDDQFVSGFMLTGLMGIISTHMDGTYQDRRDLQDGKVTSSLRLKIEQIEQTCARYELSQQPY